MMSGGMSGAIMAAEGVAVTFSRLGVSFFPKWGLGILGICSQVKVERSVRATDRS